MEDHILFLTEHCRICGYLLDRNKKKDQIATTYPVDGHLKYEDLEIAWSRILLDLVKFKINTFTDSTEIHPKYFCNNCYLAITTSIKDPSYSHRIVFFEFIPHNPSVSECVICKQHLTRRRGRLPKSRKRGRQKDEGNTPEASSLLTFPLPESIRLAQEVLAKRSDARKRSHAAVACDAEDRGTSSTPLPSTVDQATSPFKPPAKQRRGKSANKKKLAELESNNSRNRRLKPYMEALKYTAAVECDDLQDILPHLRRKLPALPEDEISNLPFAPMFCLSIKSTAYMTDSAYKLLCHATNRQASPLKIFAPLSALRKVEVIVKPGFHKFLLNPSSRIFPSDNDQSDAIRCKPIDILEGVSRSLAACPPNVIGSRYRYDKAIAQALSEYQKLVQHSLDELSERGILVPDVLDAKFKDGADGLGDVTQKVGKTMRPLPTNALRYSFSLMEISFTTANGTKHIVHRPTHPNSGLLCRTLLCAIADENDPISSAFCLLPILEEQKELQGKVLKYLDPKFPTSYRIIIYPTMVDEKLERHYCGLDIPASNYGCTVCHYNKAKDQGIFSSVPVGWKRSWEDTASRAQKRKEGGWHSKEEKNDSSKGVRAMPLMIFPAIMDATHADINISGTFMKKIYIREIAQVKDWSESPSLKEAKERFEALVWKEIGQPSKLMQGGNYGKEMVNVEKITPVLKQLVPDPARVTTLHRILVLYNRLRSVWRANYPKESVPELLAQYRATANELGKLLRDEFSYVKKWPNYLHKILAHVPDVIDSTTLETCGALASEPNEERNKSWRENRAHHTRKNLEYEQADNLRYLWLSSSYSLREMAKHEKRGYRCQKCLMPSHNKTTCNFEPNTALEMDSQSDSD